jgi:hypothetical protein
MRMICATFHCAGKYTLSKTALNNWIRYFIQMVGNSLRILPVMMNTHATIEELLDSSFSMRTVSYQKESRRPVLPRTSCDFCYVYNQNCAFTIHLSMSATCPAYETPNYGISYIPKLLLRSRSNYSPERLLLKHSHSTFSLAIVTNRRSYETGKHFQPTIRQCDSDVTSSVEP